MDCAFKRLDVFIGPPISWNNTMVVLMMNAHLTGLCLSCRAPESLQHFKQILAVVVCAMNAPDCPLYSPKLHNLPRWIYKLAKASAAAGVDGCVTV
jgi:hypothetical protein